MVESMMMNRSLIRLNAEGNAFYIRQRDKMLEYMVRNQRN